MGTTLADVIRSWQLSAELHVLQPGATERDLSTTEMAIGTRIPQPLRALYEFSNGLDLLDGNLDILPLATEDDRLCVADASKRYREWGFMVPTDVVVFGGDGSDGTYGIWIPNPPRPGSPNPVIEIGNTFEPRCMAAHGTSLIPFLASRTAYYLMLCGSDTSALDALGVPTSLRREPHELDDEAFARLRSWADPGLSDPYPDPYARGFDEQGIRDLFVG